MTENVKMFAAIMVSKGKSASEIRYFFSLYAIHNGYAEEEVLELANIYIKEMGVSII